MSSSATATATAALILAAGDSSRLGRPKQLLEFGGETLLARVLRAAKEAGCDPRIVVLGADAAFVSSSVEAAGATPVKNEDWREGMGSSLACGTRYLMLHHTEIDAVLVLTCDQPLIDGVMLRRMIETAGERGKGIVAAAYANTLGVPALFARRYFAQLSQLTGDPGAKSILSRHRADVMAVPLPEAAIDIDTEADLMRFRD